MQIGNKNVNPQQFGSKNTSRQTLGSKDVYRKIGNTLNTINSIAGPAITAAKYIAPLLL